MSGQPRRGRWGRSLTWIAILAAAGAAGCGPGTSEIIVPPVEIVIANGDGQYGTLGAELSEPLHIVLTSLRTGLPFRGATVLWEVESGDAALTTIAAIPTDSTGSARVRVRLGDTTGPVAVRATVEEQSSASVLFSLNTVERPVIDAVTPSSAAPGSSVVLTGSNFSPIADQNVVLFSGVRGAVTAASMTSLTVTVPTCLPERGVTVTTQLGIVASGSRPLAVEAGGELLTPAVGDVFDAVDPEGFACFTVDGGGTYLAIVQSTSSLGAASYPWTLTSLAANSSTTPPLVVDARAAVLDPEWRPVDPVAQVEATLRRLEKEAIARRNTAPGSVGESESDRRESGRASSTTPAPVPTVGERRTFQVFRDVGVFTEVTAEARHVGARAAFFVDDDAPAGGYGPADLLALSDQFDSMVYPTVSGAFGDESDIDASDRIIVLLTPQVNVLTPRGSSGFVGGFFYGVDLLPNETGSNAAEVIYSVVPDPAGQFSDARSRERLLEVTPAILAHELQHMVHFNERMLVRDAAAVEATWLSEALAQHAEELVARAHESIMDEDGAELFREGAVGRARRYLDGPDDVSLIISSGKGSLAERGGGFLFLLYLTDRFGASLVEDLTASVRTGVANVEAETGTEWGLLLSDWWAAVWLDGSPAESSVRSYPGLDLPSYLGAPFPLEAEELGDFDVSRTGSMRSASAGYYIVTPDAAGSATLRLGGEAGGERLPQAGLKVRIIRIQ